MGVYGSSGTDGVVRGMTASTVGPARAGRTERSTVTGDTVQCSRPIAFRHWRLRQWPRGVSPDAPTATYPAVAPSPPRPPFPSQRGRTPGPTPATARGGPLPAPRPAHRRQAGGRRRARTMSPTATARLAAISTRQNSTPPCVAPRAFTDHRDGFSTSRPPGSASAPRAASRPSRRFSRPPVAGGAGSGGAPATSDQIRAVASTRPSSCTARPSAMPPCRSTRSTTDSARTRPAAGSGSGKLTLSSVVTGRTKVARRTERGAAGRRSQASGPAH
jgi:hypothetical protein